MEEGGTMCQSIEDVDRISWEAEMMRAEEHFDAVNETAEVYIYRMPDGSMRIQCGNCGALLPQLRILAGQRSGRFVPARCPECGAEIVDIQGTED
jgi:ribosomal protein S27E